MKTFNDLEFKDLVAPDGGIGRRARMMFDNRYGVSVIQTTMSYGGKEGLYELAVLDYVKGGPIYYTSVTDDVLGWLTEDDVTTHMSKIQELEKLFLTRNQIKLLNDKEWSLVASGAYISLSKKDFKKDSVWEDICEILGVKYGNEITVLSIATKE
jgi:hypothetical protein